MKNNKIIDLYQNRIIIDPEIMAGKPVIKGTRIPVELVIKRLAQDLDVKQLQQAYPRLTLKDIKACLEYTTSLLQTEDIYPIPV